MDFRLEYIFYQFYYFALFVVHQDFTKIQILAFYAFQVIILQKIMFKIHLHFQKFLHVLHA